jgi:predicted negative regulator of RcsB-dependent stress response
MSRHELKAQDEITSKLQRFTDTAYAQKNQILAVAGIAVILVLGFAGWRWYSARQNAAAQTQLGAAIAAFTNPSVAVDKERYEKTIAEAQKTVDAYGSGSAGVMARYYIGISQDGLGDTASAVKTLQEVIDQGDSRVKPVAQFALAGIHRKHGEFQKAIDVLRQLEESSGYSRSAVTYELGVASEASGQREQAQTYYSKVVTDFPDSTFREASEASLKRMGFPVPTPPPPPALTPAP